MTSIKSIGVLGAGKTGEMIARRIIEEGFEAILVDIKPELIERAQASIEQNLVNTNQNMVTAEATEEIMRRLVITTDPAVMKNVSIVFETISEDWEAKKSAFKNIAKTCRDKTVFTTSAISWPISALSKTVPNPKRFIGMHFFFENPNMPIFEIVVGDETSKETTDKCLKVSRMLGCLTTVASDKPGFMVKRMQCAIFFEAVRLLADENTNIPSIDAAAKRAFGTLKGPFETMNDIGIDMAKTRVDGLAELGPLYQIPKRLNVQATSKEAWDLSGDADEEILPKIVDTLHAVAIQTAGELLDDEVAAIENIDLAVEFGLGWKVGPFELVNQLGSERSAELIEKLKKARQVESPASLKEAFAKKTPWVLKYVDTNITDGIATVRINRPNAANALNDTVIEQLNQTLNKIEADASIKAIVFTGTGKMLACGMEPNALAANIRNNRTEEVLKQFKKVHKLLNRISASEKITITLAYGPTMGGGVELGLASNYFVAGPRARFSFPETGFGIHPGFGGTQRLPRKVGKSIGKYVILTGEELDANAAHRIGIVDAVADDEESIEQIASELANGEDLMLEDGIPTDEELAKIALFNAKNCRSTLAGNIPDSSDEAKCIKTALGTKGPIALKLADKLIEDGFSLELAKSLNWELASMELILGTKDALRGLSSVGDAPPQFSGE